MIEETPSDPPPPDIRPCRRISSNKHNTITNRSARDAFLPNRITAHRQVSFGTDRRTTLKLLRQLYNVSTIVCVVAFLACLPLANAHAHETGSSDPKYPGRSTDPWTSSSEMTTSLYESRWTFSKTPLIASLIWVFSPIVQGLTFLAGQLGISGETAHNGMKMLGKREQLSNVQIAEAAVTPALVALSGMFAGLTLGYVSMFDFLFFPCPPRTRYTRSARDSRSTNRYFSVDPTQLQVLSMSGTVKQQEYARRILPVR